jgi:TctA family transporter
MRLKLKIVKPWYYALIALVVVLCSRVMSMMQFAITHLNIPTKNLYAVITDIGASGAYYIAAAADQIYVSPASLVGSIGVIMQGFGVQSLAQKIGCRRPHHDRRFNIKRC